jgi:hypothetical protein
MYNSIITKLTKEKKEVYTCIEPKKFNYLYKDKNMYII